jgi:hypothetical protein
LRVGTSEETDLSGLALEKLHLYAPNAYGIPARLKRLAVVFYGGVRCKMTECVLRASPQEPAYMFSSLGGLLSCEQMEITAAYAAALPKDLSRYAIRALDVSCDVPDADLSLVLPPGIRFLSGPPSMRIENFDQVRDTLLHAHCPGVEYPGACAACWRTVYTPTDE